MATRSTKVCDPNILYASQYFVVDGDKKTAGKPDIRVYTLTDNGIHMSFSITFNSKKQLVEQLAGLLEDATELYEVGETISE